jgi:tRNA pseudouridine55 synthase
MSSAENRLDEVAGLVPTGADAVILAVDKPEGMTSHDVVARIRRATGMKAGHAGTLDPFATGLLLVLLGRATRLQRYLLGLSKRYLATARLGWVSTTGDPDGDLTATGRRLKELLLPVGEIDQMVPLTSAVKVDGERLYKKAHRGEVDEDRPIRRVTVHSATLIGVEPEAPAPPERATFEVEVSSGTYVRTLIETLGDAYCEELRRTAIGAVELDPGERVVSLRDAMAFLPRIELDEEQVSEVSFGRPLSGSIEAGSEGRPVCLTFDDSVVAIARQFPESTRPEVVLTPA